MRLIGTYRTSNSWETVIVEPEPLVNGRRHWLVIAEHDPDEPEEMRRESVVARYKSRETAELAAMNKVFAAGGFLGESRVSVTNNRVALSVVKDRWLEHKWVYVNSLEERTRIAFRRITGAELPEDVV